MGLYNGAVITAAGQNLLAQAISGTELIWTAMRASSVAIPEGTDLTTLTALTGIEQTAGITDASVYGSNVVQVSARFSNTGIDTAYLMRTIGIYGQVTAGSETLIAVMTAETPDEMPAYDQDSPSAFIFNVQMSVQNANTITMVVNDTGTATVADLRRKVSLDGGDLSDTVVNTFTATIAEYPVPAAGDAMSIIGGKIVKFFADIVQTFTGASSSAAGKKGLVPAPSRGFQDSYLRADGSWTPPANYYNETREGYTADARQLNPNIANTFAYRVKQLLDEKVNATYGDISNTRVDTIDTVTDEYPTPPQGRVLSYVMGCVKKYLADLKDSKIDADGGSLSMAKVGGTVTADQPYQEIGLNDSVGEAVGKVNYTTLQTKQDIDLLNDTLTASGVDNINLVNPLNMGSSLNIDTIDGENGYIYRVRSDINSGTFPTGAGNAGLLFGYSRYTNGTLLYGAQIMVTFSGGVLYKRNCAYGGSNAWSAWATV